MALLPAVNGFVVALTLFVSLSAFITGLVTGSMNGILEMEGFKDTFRHLYNGSGSEVMTSGSSTYPNSSISGEGGRVGSVCSSDSGATASTLIGLIVSSGHFGSFLGSLVGGWLADRFSRKYGIAISGVMVVIGATFISSSFHVWMLLIGRILIGLAIGISYMVMPVYISETSPKEHRGMLASIIGPTYSFGLLVSLSMNVGFSKFHLGWRVPFMIIALLGLICAVGMLFVPHTPRWLVKRGRDKEALAVLTRINRYGSKETFVETCLEMQQLRVTTTADSEQTYSLLFKELFRWKYRFLLSVTLFFVGAVVGIFFYYSSTFFCEVGVQPFYGNLAIGIAVFVPSVVLTLIIDRLGRRSLFLGFSVFLLLITLTTAILVHLDFQSDVVGYVIVVLLCLFVLGHSASWLTISWVVSSEIFPVNIRGAVVAVSTGLFWVFSALASQTTPLIIGSPLQVQGFFYVIAGVILLGFLTVIFFLPETKGVSLEEMDKLFSQSAWQRFVAYMRCNFTMGVTVDLPQKQNKDLEEMDSCTDFKYEMNEKLN